MIVNKVSKFQVTVSPSLVEIAYMGFKQYELKFDILKFKDGSIRVKCENVTNMLYGEYLTVVAYLENMDDLMVCSQILDIVKRHLPKCKSTLKVISPLYSRYDRVMLEDKSDAFGAKCFAKFLSSQGWDTISFVDNHSNVLTDLVHGDMSFGTNCFSFEQSNIVSEFITPEYTIAPDKGSLNKLKNPTLIFDKVRNLETGKIIGQKLVEFVPLPEGVTLTVIDDLCEGGGTFLGVADEFRKHYNDSYILELYVTHGLFTNNAIPKLLEKYNRINCCYMKESVYNELSLLEKSRVKVLELVVGV